MGIFSKIFRNSYDDEQILIKAERAIAQDPVMNAMAAVGVSSQDGVVALTGSVNSGREKNHVENLVRTALDSSKTPYEDIDNRLNVV